MITWEHELRLIPNRSRNRKKKQVARMFDSIAHRYDFLNHFFSLGIDVLWRKRAMRLLKEHFAEKEGEIHLMDMATGTADFALEAARSNISPIRVTRCGHLPRDAGSWTKKN